LLITRVIVAAIGIPVLVGVIWVGGALLAAVAAAAVFVASLEVASARGALKHPLALLSAACAAALPPVALGCEEYVLAAIVVSFLLLSAALTLLGDPRENVDDWLWGVVSVLYFGGLASYFVLLREVPDGRAWVFFTCITVWVTDSGAYFVGRLTGHKLIKRGMSPSISPGKTWEGAFGSAAFGFASVFVLDAAFDLGLPIEQRIALGLLLPPVIAFGDLAESALKRALQIKDSSGLIPGHGGIADRIDSLLFAAPCVYYFVKWIVI
jgi:phosphatidate cytidylyltransferase